MCTRVFLKRDLLLIIRLSDRAMESETRLLLIIRLSDRAMESETRF